MAERRKDWFVKAGQAWTVLVQAAALKELRTYKEVCNAIGFHHRVIRYPLGIIQSYCLEERLPILAAIVVNAEHGKPGGGSVAAGRDDIDEMQADVFAYHWASLPNPFGQFGPGDNLETFTEAVIQNPAESADIYARVRVRGVAQQIFRNAVSEVYGWR